jgi:hypothetical protein
VLSALDGSTLTEITVTEVCVSMASFVFHSSEVFEIVITRLIAPSRQNLQRLPSITDRSNWVSADAGQRVMFGR